MRGHWDEIGHHAICPNKDKSKSKNQILSYQQVEHCDIIGLQTSRQSDQKISLNKIILNPLSVVSAK